MDITCENGGGISEAQVNLDNFWLRALDDVKALKMVNDFRNQELPLARIKKIMKLDEDVKMIIPDAPALYTKLAEFFICELTLTAYMISAEAPALFAKAAEFFICELTLRAWVLAEENKRRTLQRNDIATAISKYDQFDFLIDIVPREEIRPTKREDGAEAASTSEPVQYFFQVTPQQQQQQATGQIIQSPIQILTGGSTAGLAQATTDGSGAQVIQLQAPTANLSSVTTPAGSVNVAGAGSTGQTMQIITQIMTPSGDIQQIPLNIDPSQLQAIQAQMQGKQPNQPIIIQTSVDGSVAASGSASTTQFVQQ